MEAATSSDFKVEWTGWWNFGTELSIRFGAATKELEEKEVSVRRLATFCKDTF
ncbi:MAG: hypothetical protein WAM58_05555 [Candidatus Acidiferrum sp.]